VGVAQAIAPLFIFKYWNFFAGLLLGARILAAGNFILHVRIHPLRDGRYKARRRPGTSASIWHSFYFFPTMVAGPIKRYQQFLPKLRTEPSQ
jgi:alginate O-acetyltransferase complex protein AlgI